MRRLNVQGLARRDPGLMRCILPDPGLVTVSMDLASGEPSCTAHYSRDPRYRYATLDGVGKRPYFDGDVLMIDDPYIMTMSVSPVGLDLVRRVATPEWCDLWVTDNDAAKKPLKKSRDLHKMLALALSYGLGPKRMVVQCREKGADIDLSTARAFYKSYWELFAGVRRFADRIAQIVQRQGYIINEFGYRLTPEPHNGFNAYIQSTVSGIMHVFCAKLFAIAPYAQFTTLIHDEILADVPVDKVDLFKNHKELATASLNEDLGWSVAIRTGFAVGKDWFDAK